MGNYKGPTEGGTGGKRGHSGMDHCEKTEVIKYSVRKRRRVEDRVLAEEGREEQLPATVSNDKVN